MTMTTTRTGTSIAYDVARETGWNLDEYQSEREWTAVGIAPGGIHRDSDVLARSNHAVIVQDLRERFGDAVDVARFGLWAVGWIDEVTYDAGRADVSAAVDEWRARLDDYPVADDEHYSALEWDETTAYVADEVTSALRRLDVLPLTDEGQSDVLGLVLAGLESSSLDDVGDVTEDVLDAYCRVLAGEHTPQGERLDV